MKVSATTEAMKLLKQKNEEEVQQILSILDEARVEKQSPIEDLQNQINDVGDSSKWVNWVKMFGDKIDELKSSTFSFEDKRIVVDQLIDKIVVSSEDKINHKLKVYFKFPYIKDGFKWKFKKDKNGKSIKDGYELVNGKKLYTTTFISNSKKETISQNKVNDYNNLMYYNKFSLLRWNNLRITYSKYIMHIK